MAMTLSETGLTPNPETKSSPASQLNMSKKYTAEVGLVNSLRALEQQRKDKAEKLRREKPALTSVPISCVHHFFFQNLNTPTNKHICVANFKNFEATFGV